MPNHHVWLSIILYILIVRQKKLKTKKYGETSKKYLMTSLPMSTALQILLNGTPLRNWERRLRHVGKLHGCHKRGSLTPLVPTIQVRVGTN